MKKDFTKEDALIEKWKALLPLWKVTHRDSKKRRFLVMTAQVLENQEKYLKNPPQELSIKPFYEWMISK